MKILLIDADTTYQALAAEQIIASGHEVICANSAYDALTTLLDNTPDLVVCSMELPDTSGVNLLHNIRGVQGLACANLPFILTYNHMSGEDWMQALRMDVEHFISKHSATSLLTQAVHDIASGNTQAAMLAQAQAYAEFVH